MKFKVGDLVSWCGCEGRVVDDFKYQSPQAQSLMVEFECAAPDSRTPAKQRQAFLYDGKLYHWHVEPSLILK